MATSDNRAFQVTGIGSGAPHPPPENTLPRKPSGCTAGRTRSIAGRNIKRHAGKRYQSAKTESDLDLPSSRRSRLQTFSFTEYVAAGAKKAAAACVRAGSAGNRLQNHARKHPDAGYRFPAGRRSPLPGRLQKPTAGSRVRSIEAPGAFGRLSFTRKFTFYSIFSFLIEIECRAKHSNH